MTVYGYARASRGRDDGTDTLQSQRMRLTDAGVDACPYSPAHHHGTVKQRPGLNGLLNTVRPEMS